MSLARGRAAALAGLAAVAAVTLFCCSPLTAPDTSPAAQAGLTTVVTHSSPPEPSVISIPLRISLASVARRVEPKVQREFRGTSRERGVTVNYQVTRRPLTLEIIGRGVHARTKVLYAIEACTLGLPCISCGKNQSPREADVSLQSVISWGPDWRLRSSTRPLAPSFPVRCEVTPLRIDVTNRFIAPVVAQQLRIAAIEIDRNFPAAANLKPDAQKIWSSLRTPIEIAPRTWLLFEPSRVALSPLTGRGTEAVTTLTLHAMTRVTVGARPPVATQPLPPLASAAPSPAALRVPLHVDLPWSEVARVLGTQVNGKSLKTSEGNLTVESLSMSAAPPARLQIDAKIDYRAGMLSSYRGTVAFSGTPKLDAATSTLTMPDLEYVLGSDAGFIARTADRLAHDSLRDRLRQSLRIDLQPHMNRLRNDVARALTRQLAPGTSMRGRVDDMRITALTPRPEGLALQLLATGAAEITVE